MRTISNTWNVILTAAYAGVLGLSAFPAHAAQTFSNTQTCTDNGVRIDCKTRKPIDQGDVLNLCPDRRFEFIYGKACDYRFSTLRFRAVKLQHSYEGHGFHAGAQFTVAYGMNDNGSVVGEAKSSSGEVRAVSVEVGNQYPENIYFSNFGVPRRSSSIRAIANNYFMVGTAQREIANTAQQATVWDSQYGWHQPLQGLAGKTGVATGIGKSFNQRLFVSGYDVWPVADGGDGKVHAFLWSWHGRGHEGFTMLGHIGQTSRALDVNDRGQVVGYLSERGVEQAFESGTGTLDALPDFGNFASRALDINNNALAKTVGYAKNNRGAKQAVLWQNKQMTPLPHLPKKSSSSANAITDAGDIVGESGGRATLWRDGVVYDLNALLEKSISGTLSSAVDINLLGRILTKASDGYYVLIPTSDL